MKAIILAGGYATRLRPISYALPKLLFPIVGKPIIYRTLDMLDGIGVEEVVLAVNYLADALREEVGSSYKGIAIQYSLESMPMGTGGPIKLASQTTHFDETFIALNGDVIANINLQEMLEHHKRNNAAFTDAIYQVKDPKMFGVAELDHEGWIRSFIEKPKGNKTHSRLVNAGIYIMEPEVLEMIPPNRKVSLEREIFPLLAEERKLLGFPFSGQWFDIGSLSDYQKANFSLLAMQTEGMASEQKLSLGRGAVIKPPIVLGRGTKVGNAAVVGPRVIGGKGESIGHRARVSNSILFDRVSLGEGSVVSGAILGSDVTVGRHVKIEPGAILSPWVRVHDDVRIGRKAVIHPHKEVESSVKPETHVM